MPWSATSFAILLLSSPPGTWQHAGRRGVSAGPAICCDIASDSQGIVHVAYQDQSLGEDAATVQTLTGGAWGLLGPQGEASILQAWYDRLAFGSDGAVFLACRDYGVGGRINVRRYDAGTGSWSDVGVAGPSAGEAHYTDIAVGSDGSPWVVYADRATVPGDRATVLHFSGGAWITAGAPGISEAAAQYTSIAIGPGDVPTIAFTDMSRVDGTGAGRISVMRFDAGGNRWDYVGSPGFSPSGGSNARLAFDRTGAPCVAYHQYHLAVRVWRFDGAQWVQLGSSASGSDHPTVETEAWRQWLSLDFDSQNAPYVAYQRWDFENRAAVRRFDGTDWVPVGQLGFSPPNADYLAMTVDRSDVPWVVFRDSENGDRATVMRFSAPPSTYCTGSTDALGCTPRITASATSRTAVIHASGLVNQSSAALFYGTSPAATPFGGAILCVGTPYRTIAGFRTGGASSGADCSGQVSFDFAAWIRAGGDPSITTGMTVFAQLWFRDRWSPTGVGSTDAVRFVIGL